MAIVMAIAMTGVTGVMALPGATGVARADQWRPAYEKDGVEVDQRAVAGERVRATRGVATLGCSASRVMAVLGDVDAHAGMIPPIAAVRWLRHEAGGEVYHMVIDPPVVARRDYCIRIAVTALAGGGYRSEFTVESQGCPPPQGGIVRMVVNTGSWTVEPLTAGSARVTYEAITDPVGATPAWLVNRVNPRAIVSTFASLRRAAALPRYQQCGVDLAGCPAIRLHPPR